MANGLLPRTTQRQSFPGQATAGLLHKEDLETPANVVVPFLPARPFVEAAGQWRDSAHDHAHQHAGAADRVSYGQPTPIVLELQPIGQHPARRLDAVLDKQRYDFWKLLGLTHDKVNESPPGAISLLAKVDHEDLLQCFSEREIFVFVARECKHGCTVNGYHCHEKLGFA